MNKAELIEAVHAAASKVNASLKKSSVEAILSEALSVIRTTVKKDAVTLVGFGTFTKTKRKARTGRNPQSGKEIKIPARTVPKFKPGKEFKKAVR